MERRPFSFSLENLAVHGGEEVSEYSTAVLLVLVVRRLRGDKPSPYRYGWILTVISMFLFPFVSLAKSQLVATLFFILWYYIVIWTFSWEAAPKKAKSS